MEKVGLQPSYHKTNTYMNPHTTLTMLEYYGHSGLIIIMKYGVVSLQLPVEYSQLPAYLSG